jgi:Sec-independent protein translocase protein TatA
MDSILGIGMPELIVILLLAGMVMGPHRIRQVARTLGRLTAQLQGISREFARQLNAELDALDDGGQVKGAFQDMRELQREVESLRQELRRSTAPVLEEGKQALNEGKQALEESRQAFKPITRQEPAPAEGDGDDRPELPKPLEVLDDPE